ncbi:unnamed protein product [Cuscuta campestris]|uniref:X8 domain-containing protein n=2 Tax=Cuscuta sect. Cleistogrammica TaxID=1824901 RepID=A0A484KIQ9_9ASTE|nr:hypothetical protein DM860_014700 [Cuscuta australis]VFQ61846.1 unnamed protein product [Cuscuta campestris]
MSKLFSFSIFFYLLSTLCAAQEGNSSAGNGGGASLELWCVAKNNAEDAALQSAIDWACGAGGADCGPIQAGGPCHDASDIRRMASYAFNDYFIKHGMANGTCDFQNSAALTSLNPNFNSCKLPSSLSRPFKIGVGTSQADAYDSSSVKILGWMWGLITICLLLVPALIM